MNDIDVPVALVALSENRSRIWLSWLLSFFAIIALVNTYARIMVRTILNLEVALTACGMFAGRVTVSPALTP